ncbi:class I SAM-dependent methyltransferase [Ancylobacter sp. Lp-2]|uniref:class I SAM-dependent methyltransferase n=1 Tax=Ancylobacter sp. Lp-2 TaxID=2881339 RepID=UPI001E5C1922|nr:class I SAM-dependent methyltransferase [Ancylobacter sp. Lp-2]MCB4768490.1 class I SAM-dependent methyltransferase [Ancylobacter sp. Lp-2]
MLEKAQDPRYATISRPAPHAIDLLGKMMEERPQPIVAEVGVGVGATSAELCRRLDGAGQIHFFDYGERITDLLADLQGLGFSNIHGHANSRRFLDSYAWTLGKLVLERRAANAGNAAMFDFIFFDGAHAYHHDASSTVLLKELLRPGGVLLMDDYDWSFAKSPTMRQNSNPPLEKLFTDEQIETCHVKFICDLFLDNDPAYQRLDIGYTPPHEHRRAYRKAG